MFRLLAVMMSTLFATTLAAQVAPTITVLSGTTNIPNETAVAVSPGDTVAGLALTITIDDADNDNVATSVAVSNVTTQGVNPAEWSSASAAVSYDLTPTSGTFNVADVEHTIILTATDGTFTTTFTIFVVVAASTGNSTPKVVLLSDKTYLAPFSAVPIPYNTNVSALALEAFALDADAAAAMNISIAVSNFTTQGLVVGEWQATGAASGAKLTPTSGQFNVGDVAHVVSVTVNDGTTSATYHWILLIGPDGMTTTNAAPFIGLFAGDTYIAQGATVPIPFNTLVSALSLQLIVADFEGDSTSSTLAGVSNFTTQGLIPAEWESAAAATPYTLTPTSGQFNVASISHLVSLEAADAGATTSYNFTLAIGAAAGTAGKKKDDDNCSTGQGSGFSWLMLAALAAMGVAGIRLRAAK